MSEQNEAPYNPTPGAMAPTQEESARVKEYLDRDLSDTERGRVMAEFPLEADEWAAERDPAVVAAATLSQAALVQAAKEAMTLALSDSPTFGSVTRALELNKAALDADGENYVVDVFVPVSIEVRADNAEQAASMALDMLVEQGLRQRIDDLVNNDWESFFVVSDSPAQAEVGEA